MSLLLFLVLATADPRPTIAVIPPIPEPGEPAWVGMSIADDLTSRLLVHSRLDPGTMQRRYPVSVFGWRQALSAARGEGIDATVSLPAKDAERVVRQLGADALLVGGYRVSGKTLFLTWRLYGKLRSKKQTLRVPMNNISQASEKVFDAVLKRIGEDPSKVTGHELTNLPLATVRPFGEALRILKRQSLDPRAQVVLPRAEIARAHALLAAATDSTSEFSRGWVHRGVASAMLGETTRSEEEFIQAMAHTGEFSPTNALGLYYFYDRQGKHEDAIKVLKDSTDAHMGFLHGLGYLGQAYLRCNHPHEALATFTSYHSRAPRNPWVRAMRAQALARIGKHEQAVTETKELLAELPESLMVLCALASRQIDAKRYDDARDSLERALAIHADHPALLTRLSYIELEQGRPKSGLELANKAVQIVGDARGKSLAGYAHANLGHALARLGRKQEAFDALRRAMQLGLTADDRLRLLRDPKLRDFLNDPRCPIGRDTEHKH